MSDRDNAPDAVEQLAEQHMRRASWGAAGYLDAARNTTREAMFHQRTAAMLRALSAECAAAHAAAEDAKREAFAEAAQHIEPASIAREDLAGMALLNAAVSLRALSTQTSQPARQHGKTAAQILAAPRGAVFIWPAPFSLSYAQHLARHLGRPDLQILPLGVLLEPHRLQSLSMSPRELILDHACAQHMSDQHWRNLEHLQARRRRHG
ncbi:hypothetical protein KTR66_19515 [Roseococcus sp. SDR]|uniref:hypothetical protein n=1 Tax=Roseococcus sp. SDR TaxID=2835532 RepID=UPI001BCA9293|nr:hypothetical protein [Roseococcus sp. SDR]MBS7792197.1 hypothetical protein [Roseococcus sp. SDR]MBV1847511.1 hypothetical protein [Roseococcus sp. SDR]